MVDVDPPSEDPGGHESVVAHGENRVLQALHDLYGMGVGLQDLHSGSQLMIQRSQRGAVAVDRVMSNSRFSFDAGPIDSLMVLHLRGGTYETTTGGVSAHVAGWEPLIAFQPGSNAIGTVDHMDTRTITIDMDLVRSVSDTAHDDRRRLRFTSLTAPSHGLRQAWMTTADYAARALETESAANPLFHDTVARALAGTALAVFPNTFELDDLHYTRAGFVGAATVRRAQAFVEACAAEPLTPAVVAAHVQLSAAALEDGFRRHLSCSVMDFVTRLRLRRAHEELAALPAGTSVAQVSARWGWTSHRRFVDDYRRVYGEIPRQRTGA
ncbi:helix-turn-helix transcriptional regulator [Streptomyces sp. SID8367]|uniref:helix-turn-helix transcriptional regulator n=1 Tax=Streptomyces sp. SID8367 TaxID=2690349 RepID=UPI000DC314E6|nr:helix-turn-helix transcriptional regulator [Streptomyces sp. SID8367]MYT73822.1 helix-turn-helix domain-containing protein [Streptomyces sp. SID8367]RAJ89235.1 helix-turn-helix protein [Streptomyces sp. PsTaAH-137]